MTDEKVILALAEQAYMFHLLVKTLREAGILAKAQLEARWDNQEFALFLSDYRRRYFAEP